MRIHEKQTYAPTSVYKKESLEGFAILINPEVLSHRKEAINVRKEISSQLRRISRVVPVEPLATLKKVQMWVEWENGDIEAPVFHPSVVWLEENCYNPDKAGGIELSNTGKFIEWSRAEQPWLLMHELSHAYVYLVLGENHKGLEAAYKQAVERKLYDSVPYIKGGKERAYALTNANEYYAELSEAYFGKNDFYPFVHNELKKHDPVGYQLMEETWGKPEK
jgi:hypothetical protein